MTDAEASHDNAVCILCDHRWRWHNVRENRSCANPGCDCKKFVGEIADFVRDVKR